jgi:hypothetical protein
MEPDWRTGEIEMTEQKQIACAGVAVSKRRNHKFFLLGLWLYTAAFGDEFFQNDGKNRQSTSPESRMALSGYIFLERKL